MNIYIRKYTVLAVLCLSINPVFAGDSVEQSFQALGYSLEGGFKMVSAAAAIPLVSIGEIGTVTGDIGHELLDEAARPPGQYHANRPFPVTDEIVTAGPGPSEQLQRGE